jgi:hypothetical protein
MLPRDLAGSLRRLDDREIDALLWAVTAEAGRRGRIPEGNRRLGTQPVDRRSAAEKATEGLTTGKLNAVRAAFKAGVKTPAIARQFGISQSAVRKALASEARDRKSGR